MEMGSRYEVEVTVVSARDLKNVNWRHGDLKPYAVLWVDDGPKCSTRVADLHDGDNPVVWDDDKLVLPLPPSAANSPEDAVLYIDVVHADAAEGVKPLVGSARLPLRDVLDDDADTIGGGKPTASRTLRLKRPSGRPHGRLDVRVAVVRYYDPTVTAGPYPAPYGQPPVAGSRDDDPYYYDQPAGYPAADAGAGYYDYGYGGGAPPQPAYGAPAPETAGYGSAADPASQKKNNSGRKMGLAVGAAAGVLGGLALAGGASYVEHKLEENVAEDLASRDDDDDYGCVWFVG